MRTLEDIQQNIRETEAEYEETREWMAANVNNPEIGDYEFNLRETRANMLGDRIAQLKQEKANWKMLQAAETLNAEAFVFAREQATAAQLKRARKNPKRALETFAPCERARVYQNGTGGHLGTVREIALRTICRCHGRISLGELLEKETTVI